MLEFEEKRYIRSIPKGNYVLAGDIGGTNSNFGILGGEKLKLYFSLRFKSKEIKNFSEVVKQVLKYVKKKYSISINSACFAAAGMCSKNRVQMTNRDFFVDTNQIKRRTKLKQVFIINDFEAISYGIVVLGKNKFIQIKNGKKVSKAPKIVVGAGTGLGKGFLIYEKDRSSYIAYPSEGGHGDAVAIGEEDRKLFSFIQKETGREVVEWEDLVSGKGIPSLYHFAADLKKYPKTKYREIIMKSPDPGRMISKYKHVDPQARDAYKMFIKFYSRCAKNFALDMLAFGGVYIAGGIAADNPEPFKHKIFNQEFTNTRKQKEILKKIPVFIIKDYNVSLYGAGVVAKKGGK